MMGFHVRRNSLVMAVLAIGFAAAVPATGQATDVKVENYSNETIYVAVAYNHYKGNLAAEGWFAVKTNENRTFTADDKYDMHLRVVRKGSKEITFEKHKTFLSWPVEPQRFSVSKEPDDTKIWVLKWGKNLDKSDNINKGGELPKGWTKERFFKVGSGSQGRLEIKPN